MKTLPRIDQIAFGQNAEDVILTRAFQGTQNGTYVDAGAGHPTLGSITKNLYDHLGFYGVEIEPIPYLAGLLTKERPLNKVINVGIGTKSSNTNFYECKSDWALSTFDKKLKTQHESQGKNFETQDVPLRTLNEILEEDKNVNPGFELLKLDIEGWETKILTTFNLQKWRPQIILAETTTPGTNPSRINTTAETLKPHGYEETFFDGTNPFFLHEDHKNLREKLSFPPKMSDYYIPHVWWNLLSPEIQTQYPHLQKL